MSFKKKLDISAFKCPIFQKGSVWLVGAGPGDAGLLTLHALNALSCADVIVYDALVSDECLQFANKKAEIIFAGKRGGKPSPKQQDITEKLIIHARDGKRVLRLKGGDPFVFGRGGEEAIALRGAKIPFVIVPGITAGIGGIAYAGIPLTHRDSNSTVTFITGHSLTGEVPDNIDWPALARGSTVLVLYMALKHMDRIAEHLLKNGRDGGESVAIICNATTDKQLVLQGKLNNICALAKKASSPAVTVIGPVVDLRDILKWSHQFAPLNQGNK